nr:MAG TPA: hypothetical protein [Caudoviricetes sp.]
MKFSYRENLRLDIADSLVLKAAILRVITSLNCNTKIRFSF